MLTQLRFKDSLEIHSNTGYYNEEGKWIQANSAPAPTPILCNIQPMRKRKDFENLPEGKSPRQAWVVYTTHPIKTADPLTGEAGDTTTIDGFLCEAVYSEKWRRNHLAHYKVSFVREEVEANQ